MKLTTILSFFLLFLVSSGCEDELLLPALDEAPLPSGLSLDFRITGDNSGTVTVIPGGQGVTSFTVDFGDGSADRVSLAPGESITNVYGEGTYTVSLEAMNIAGQTTTYTEDLTVSFAAPDNLEVTVTPTAGNPLSVDVTATADGETNFLAYFGEDPDAEPTSFQEGETVSHEYGSTGTYEVIVEARSGGAASVTDTVTVEIVNPVLLPINFEDASKTYGFAGFGGATVEVVDNPDPSGANTSARVAKLTKQQDSETFAGAVIELGENIDFSASQQLSVDVWSPVAGIPVLLKVENPTNNEIFIEVIVNTTVANQWETLTFDYSVGDLEEEYNKVAIFFDFGNPGTGTDYYFDDIRPADAEPGTILELPLTFESADVTYGWAGFGGADVELIDNPDISGINTSTRVGQLFKGEGSEVWAGGVIELPQPIDLATYPRVAVKVWSPAADIPVLLKVENGTDPNVFIEVTVNTTVANQWEELTFDFSVGDLEQSYSKLAIFFDFNTEGTGATYYFDDIRQIGDEPAEVVEFPLSFESTDLDYGLAGFGRAEADIIDNPDASGINTSTRVGHIFKADGSEVWAGGVVELAEAIDFGRSQQLSVKVWSPEAGIPVLLKVENGSDPNVFIEVTQNTTVANQWEALTYDFSSGDLSQSYSKVAIFFDFNTAGTGADYYFDDVQQVP